MKVLSSSCCLINICLGNGMLLVIYRMLHGKCALTVFTHELWRIRNWTVQVSVANEWDFRFIQRAWCFRKSTPHALSLYLFYGLPFFHFVDFLQTVQQINYEIQLWCSYPDTVQQNSYSSCFRLSKICSTHLVWLCLPLCFSCVFLSSKVLTYSSFEDL